MTDDKRAVKIARQARKLRAVQEQIRELYALRDELEESILKALPVGESLEIGGGYQVESVDNFATKNVCFGHGPVRRFEAKLSRVKAPVKPGEAK